jgi:hypothetical protein
MKCEEGERRWQWKKGDILVEVSGEGIRGDIL